RGLLRSRVRLESGDAQGGQQSRGARGTLARGPLPARARPDRGLAALRAHGAIARRAVWAGDPLQLPGTGAEAGEAVPPGLSGPARADGRRGLLSTHQTHQVSSTVMVGNPAAGLMAVRASCAAVRRAKSM